MGIAKADTGRAAPDQPLVVRSSRRAWERHYVRTVVGIDAVAALVAGMAAYDVRWADPRCRSRSGSTWR